MTPEVGDYLDKARKHLEHAGVMLGVGLNEDAGRAAYLAGFHAAQAFIFDRSGKVAKTHSGVRSELARLAKNDSRLDRAFLTFLGQAYNLKTVADYTVGSVGVTAAEVEQVISKRPGALLIAFLV